MQTLQHTVTSKATPYKGQFKVVLLLVELALRIIGSYPLTTGMLRMFEAKITSA
jgi:hypothetical protein